MNNKLQSRLVGFCIGFLALGLFLLNRAVPRFADDFCRFSAEFDLTAILSAVVDDYTTWTGRFPVLTATRVVFSLGDAGLLLFDLANAAFFALASYLALHFGSPGAASRNLMLPVCVLAFFCFLFWFSPHRLGETLLWKTGAIQYFWGPVIALWVLKPVLDHVVHDMPATFTGPRLTGFLIVCFLGGAWLEHLSVAVIVLWSTLLASHWYWAGKALNKHLVAGLACWSAGALVLLIAPGNYQRAGSIGYHQTFFERGVTTIGYLYEYLDKGLLIIVVLFALFQIVSRSRNISREILTAAILAGVGALSMLAMAAAPASSFIGRAAFPFEFFMIYAAVSLFPVTFFTNAKSSNDKFTDDDDDTAAVIAGRLLPGIAAALFVAVAADYVLTLRMYSGLQYQEQRRHDIIELARKNGNTRNIPLPALFFGEQYSTINGSVNTGRYFARDITPQIDHWRNRCYARAHKVESVRLGYDYSKP